jgi:hypothetical protein
VHQQHGTDHTCALYPALGPSLWHVRRQHEVTPAKALATPTPLSSRCITQLTRSSGLPEAFSLAQSSGLHPGASETFLRAPPPVSVGTPSAPDLGTPKPPPPPPPIRAPPAPPTPGGALRADVRGGAARRLEAPPPVAGGTPRTARREERAAAGAAGEEEALPAAAAGPETEKLGAALLLGVPAAAARLGPACARLLLLPPLRCALFSAGNAGGA